MDYILNLEIINVANLQLNNLRHTMIFILYAIVVDLLYTSMACIRNVIY